MKEASLLISTGSTVFTNAVYLYYDQNSNLLYLRNDAATAWLGGYAPGSSNTIENSQVKVNCASSSYTGSSNALTVNWNITFKSAYSGNSYRSYLYAKDDAGVSAGWSYRGSYIVNYPPAVGTVSPSSGTGQLNVTQNFIATYTDPDGWQNIKYAYFLVNLSSSSSYCLYTYYDRPTNKLYLRNAADNGWLGGYAPGSANIIDNGYAKLDCATTTVSGSGTTLTVNWSAIFVGLTGAEKTYLSMTDNVNASVRATQKGTWTIPNQAPSVGTITPSSVNCGINTLVNLTATYSDPDGLRNMQRLSLLVNIYSYNGQNCLYAFYDCRTGKFTLANDSCTGSAGESVPGASGAVLENSYVKLDCTKASVAESDNTLTIVWPVIFKSTFTGVKNAYLTITDNALASSGWVQKGTVTIDATPPSITIASVTTPTNQNVTLSYTVSDDLTPTEEITVTGDQSPYVNEGTYNVTLTAQDKAGNTTTASTGFVIDKTGPAVTVTSPLDGIVIRSSAINLEGTVDGVSFSEPRTLTEGLNTLTKTATDNVGNISYGWVAVTYNPNGGTYNLLTTLEAENMPTKTSGGATTGGWCLWSNGYVEDTFDFPVTANYKFDVVARGTYAGGGWPNMEVRIDGVKVENKAVVLKAWANYAVETQITAGAHRVAIAFTNDYYKPPEDRNLYVDKVSILQFIETDDTPPVITVTSPSDGAVVEDSPVQFEGTVDGVVFSESKDLVEGLNTLTKTATDDAGNTSTKSITVYLYSGQTIGPEGGEVVSPDGHVKLMIPAGALTEPTQIRIKAVNNSTLEGTNPSGTDLLMIVECKPYGLIFGNGRSAELVYTLYSGQVPGTPVELGLYNPTLNKIESTGQTSIVPVDGYTVSFYITHFSTYAALQSLTPQSTPIGVGVKIPLPDLLTGAFSHSVPITVAPGRKGMQPAIALNYRSGGSNSWTGMSFNLNPGYIVRSTRLGPALYTDNDTFYLVTDTGTTELVYLTENLYQAKVEGAFTKYFKEQDDSWKVLGKDGSIMYFGQTNDSKETNPSKGTFSWYITKAVDTNGNYVEFNYTKDQGKSYLYTINYTGNENGTSPTNTVEFFLEPREDVFSSYISGAKVTTAKRLKEIQAKVNSELVWRYTLEYAYSPDTNRSLLKTVTQYSSDNKSLPKQNFTYQTAK